MQRYHSLGIADQFGNIGSCNALFKENSCEGVPESMWRGFLFERTRKIKNLPTRHRPSPIGLRRIWPYPIPTRRSIVS